MNILFEKLKEKNHQVEGKKNRMLFIGVAVMMITGGALLMVDIDRFSTVSAFLIFFALIGLIIGLFVIALKSSRLRQQRIKHSVEVIYKKYIEDYNIKNGSSYQFDTINEVKEKWYLVPSFAHIDCDYSLENDDIKMYHGTAFNKVGDKQQVTYYFKGIYIVLDGPLGDCQYRDKAKLTEKIINHFKNIYANDEFSLSNYQYKQEEESGTFYSQNKEKMPLVMKNILANLRTIAFVDSVKIGLKNKRLHIAIEQDAIRLPYIKKYTQKELDEIQKVVNESAKLLDGILALR